MIYLYNFILLILFIPAALLVALRYRKRFSSEFFFKAGERLGAWKLPDNIDTGKPLVWVHCASLGEAKAIEPVIRKLDGYTILITTVTLSGRKYAIDMKLTSLVYFAPFDISFLVGKIFKNIKISALLLVETELWPGMLVEAGKHGTSVILVNGRLSAHSFPMYNLFRGFWKDILGNISLICARSQEDAQRFKALGVDGNRITVTGNIKYDNDNGKQVVSKQDLGFNSSDLIWVCGSTRKGENEILIKTYTELKKTFSSLKLVIAPRHLSRAKEIEVLARKAGLTFSHWSAFKNLDVSPLYSQRGGKGEFESTENSPNPSLNKRGGNRTSTDNESCDCLIVDTFGELWKFYSACDIAFVGGSLIDNGGQNPIEPAAFSKPVLFGSYMGNFLGESRVITQTGGGFTVKDGRELADKMKELLSDDKLRMDAGRKACEAVQSQKGAVGKTVALINSTMAARSEGAGK